MRLLNGRMINKKMSAIRSFRRGIEVSLIGQVAETYSQHNAAQVIQDSFYNEILRRKLDKSYNKKKTKEENMKS